MQLGNISAGLGLSQGVLQSSHKGNSSGLSFGHLVIIKLEVFKSWDPNMLFMRSFYSGSIVDTVTGTWARMRYLCFSSAVYNLSTLGRLLNSSEL